MPNNYMADKFSLTSTPQGCFIKIVVGEVLTSVNNVDVIAEAGIFSGSSMN